MADNQVQTNAKTGQTSLSAEAEATIFIHKDDAVPYEFLVVLLI